MKRTRLLVSVVLCFVLVFTFSACSTTHQSTESTDTQLKKEGVKIQFMTWATSQGEAGSDVLKKSYLDLIPAYEKMSGNKVEFQEVPFDQYRMKYQTMFVSNSAPEVLYYNLEAAWEDYNKGFLLNYNDLLEKENPYIKGTKWKDTFQQLLLELSVDKTNGVYSFLPDGVSVIRIYYNKDLYQKAGISEAPKTWAEFIEACKKLKDAGIVPFLMPNSKAQDNQVLWFTNSLTGQLDSSIRTKCDLDKSGIVTKNEQAYGVDEGIIDFTKSPLKDTYALMKEFSQYWSKDFNSLDNGTALNMWLNGDGAMIALSSPDLREIETMEGRKFDYGLMPMPTITKDTNPNASGKSVVLGGRPVGGLSVNKALEKGTQDAAVDFVQYLLSDEPAVTLLKNCYRLSSLTNVQADPATQEKLKGFSLQNEEIVKNNYYAPSTSTEFNQFFIMEGQLYYFNNITSDQFMSELNKKFKSVFEDMKKTNNWSKENNYGIKK